MAARLALVGLSLAEFNSDVPTGPIFSGPLEMMILLLLFLLRENNCLLPVNVRLAYESMCKATRGTSLLKS